MAEQQLTKKERRLLRKQEQRAEQAQAAKQQAMKKWLGRGGMVALIVVAGFGLYWIGSRTADSNQVVSGNVVVTDQDWVKGNSEASVTVVEYGDFQCPACRFYAPLVAQLNQDLGDRVRIVFRHFPLTSIHGNAVVSARAAEAAGLQGKFWEMHDILYDQQPNWANVRDPRSLFIAYGEQIGLDPEKFQADLNSRVVADAVTQDLNSATALRLRGTPSFLINDRLIENPVSYDEFRTTVETALGPIPQAAPGAETSSLDESAESTVSQNPE
jgi:protein-disulfide isomerase